VVTPGFLKREVDGRTEAVGILSKLEEGRYGAVVWLVHNTVAGNGASVEL